MSEWTDLHGTGGSIDNRPKFWQKFLRPYEDYTEKRSKLIAEKLVVISQGLKERAIKLGISESRIIRIPGGADVDSIYPQMKDQSRSILGFPLDKKIIAYHCRYTLRLRSFYRKH